MRDEWKERRKYFNMIPLTDFWIVLLGCLPLCQAAPIIAPTVSPDEQDIAKEYLSQFYTDVGMANSSVQSITNDSFSKDLKAMQAFFGLEVTGILNKETVEVMKKPRCGVSDISQFALIPGRPKWQKRLITYMITHYTQKLTQHQVDATIAQAFQIYSDVIPLDFKQVYTGSADIMILFKGGCIDLSPSITDFIIFSVQLQIMGTFTLLMERVESWLMPTPPERMRGGGAHFDDDETWTLSQRGVNLLLVAAHEFGHALGLAHSRDKRALMYPNYHYVNTNGYRLPDDDIRGVQALYGSRTPVPTLMPRPGPGLEPDPDLNNPRDEQCSNELVFDAATSIWGDLYFFKNGYYWRKSTTFTEIRFTKVNTNWPGINYVDAAFEVPHNDVVYLFEGQRYWAIRAHAGTLLPGYPKSITNLGLPSSVSKVDAAVYVPTLGRTLIFVDQQYWRYDDTRNQMDNGYPRYILWDFPGIGSKVDAAFENYGYLYFSNGARQSQFYLPYRRVTRVLYNYSWLNCY